MNKQVRYILFISFFAVMLTYWVAGLYEDLARPGSDDGWRAPGQYGVYYIADVNQQSPAKELRKGDQVIAINGVRLADDPRMLNLSRRVPPGTHYTITVLRDGQELTFTLQTFPRPPGPFPWGRLVPPLFWLTGLFVFLLKAEDQQA